MKNNNFFENKKILITGHSGFKGGWLTKILHGMGASIMGISLPPKTKDDFYNTTKLEKYCLTEYFNILEKAKLSSKIIQFEPDIIFHLAAQPLVRYSYNYPEETFSTNVIGTLNILDSLKEIKNKVAVVIVTTDKVYQNLEWSYPYRENDRLGGYDPYSASKACAELVVRAYRQSYFNLDMYDKHEKSLATVRAGNVIGGGDWSQDRLLPDIMRSIRNGEKIVIRNPNAIRPWQHVLEPLWGYIELSEKLYNLPKRYSGEWNFGPFPEDSLRVENLVKNILEIMGKGDCKIEESPSSLHEAQVLKLDISKSLNNLDWKPRLLPMQALEWTANWYKKYFENMDSDMSIFTEYQIETYNNLISK
jgi:CDP-glucose 4,6-dehydratase